MGSLPAQQDARVTVSDPQHPERVYAAGDAGVFRSDDGGQTWEAAGHGIEAAAQAMALDPRQPQRLYVATSNGALYVTEDGASTWQPIAGSSASGR